MQTVELAKIILSVVSVMGAFSPDRFMLGQAIGQGVLATMIP